MRSRVTGRGGWTLVAEQDDYQPWLLAISVPAAPRYLLDNLAVTREQAHVITGVRACAVVREASRSYRYSMGGEIRYALDGIELTGDEARLIALGQDPLAVLLPRLMVRALTAEEMMTG